MLDDLKLIHERDAQDALGIAEKGWQQYLHNFKFDWNPPQPINEVIVAGMGGSGLAGKAYKNFGSLQVPFEVIQGYDLPKRINKNTLLICSSYSGNTEETLSVMKSALEIKHQMVIVIASGGELLELAKENNLPYIELPKGYQPRHTFGYQYRALTEIFDNTPLVSGQIPVLENTAKWLGSETANFLPEKPTGDNPAKALAQDLVGSSVVIYASYLFAPAAYKWKISFNENAKNIAWYNEYSEFNHNEFIGWTSHPVDKPYKIINLRSSFDYPQIKKRFEVSERLLSGKMPHPETVEARGDSALVQMLWLVQFGDFVTLYVALLNGLNPTPVELIEKLKGQLK